MPQGAPASVLPQVCPLQVRQAYLSWRDAFYRATEAYTLDRDTRFMAISVLQQRALTYLRLTSHAPTAR